MCEKGKLMKIKDWIIIGLFVSLCAVLAIGRGKTEGKEDTSSTVQNINIDELMRKRVVARLKQTMVRGGKLGDISVVDVAEMATEWSRGRYRREWGVEVRAGGRERLDENLPTSMEVDEDMSLYELLYRVAEATDIEIIIEPDGVILCREWDK